MSATIERVKVILTALVTWITAAAAAVSIFAEEIVGLLPDDWQGGFTEGAVYVVAVLAAAVSIIRRVTPVLPAERGILPPAQEG